MPQFFSWPLCTLQYICQFPNIFNKAKNVLTFIALPLCLVCQIYCFPNKIQSLTEATVNFSFLLIVPNSTSSAVKSASRDNFIFSSSQKDLLKLHSQKRCNIASAGLEYRSHPADSLIPKIFSSLFVGKILWMVRICSHLSFTSFVVLYSDVLTNLFPSIRLMGQLQIMLPFTLCNTWFGDFRNLNQYSIRPPCCFGSFI